MAPSLADLCTLNWRQLDHTMQPERESKDIRALVFEQTETCVVSSLHAESDASSSRLALQVFCNYLCDGLLGRCELELFKLSPTLSEQSSRRAQGAAVIFDLPRLAFKATATCSRYAGKLRRATTASEPQFKTQAHDKLAGCGPVTSRLATSPLTLSSTRHVRGQEL